MSRTFSLATRSVFPAMSVRLKSRPSKERSGRYDERRHLRFWHRQGLYWARANEIALGYQYFDSAIRAVLPATSVKRKSRPSKGQVRVLPARLPGRSWAPGFAGQTEGFREPFTASSDAFHAGNGAEKGSLEWRVSVLVSLAGEDSTERDQ